MNPYNHEDELRELLAEIVCQDVSHLGLDDDLILALDIDSLRGLEILATVEKHYDVILPSLQLSQVNSLRKLLEIIDNVEMEEWS